MDYPKRGIGPDVWVWSTHEVCFLCKMPIGDNRSICAAWFEHHVQAGWVHKECGLKDTAEH